MRKPEHIPANFVYVEAPDGCAYWIHPKYVGGKNYFVPCSRFENHDTEESWHTGDQLKEVVAS